MKEIRINGWRRKRWGEKKMKEMEEIQKEI